MSDVPAVRIVAVPPGEAPLHVREAWVGLVLPLMRPSIVRAWVAGGVLTGPRTVLGQRLHRLLGLGRSERGYAVRVADALSQLEAAHPWAAHWWRENTPHLLRPGRIFLFAPEACEEVSGLIWPPAPKAPGTAP